MFKHLGLPVREFTEELLYVVGKKKLPLFGKDKIKYKLTTAYILKASIIQAGSGVLDGSALSDPAVALYTFDKDFYLDEEKLLEITEKVRALRTKEDLTDEEIEIANLLTDGNSYFYHKPVPKSLTDGKEYFITRMLLKSEYFADQKLPDKLIIDGIVYIRKDTRLKPDFEQINVHKYLKLKV